MSSSDRLLVAMQLALSRRVALGLDLTLITLVSALAIVVASSRLMGAHPDLLSAAVVFDLVVTLAVGHWMLGVRRGGLPAWTVSIVALGGAALAGAVLPDVEASGLVAALALVELSVGGVALLRARVLWRGVRTARAAGLTGLDALERGLAAALESAPLARAVVTELRLVWLGAFGWCRRAQPGGFTSHREVGWLPLAGALVGLSLIEIPIVHLLLADLVGTGVAWTVTAVSAYGVLWLWGDAQAMRLHPTTIDTDRLHLRVGLRWSATVRLSEVVAAERTPSPAGIDVSILGPNVRLTLRHPATVHGLLGQTRMADVISLRVDEPDAFLMAVRANRTP